MAWFDSQGGNIVVNNPDIAILKKTWRHSLKRD